MGITQDMLPRGDLPTAYRVNINSGRIGIVLVCVTWYGSKVLHLTLGGAISKICKLKGTAPYECDKEDTTFKR